MAETLESLTPSQKELVAKNKRLAEFLAQKTYQRNPKQLDIEELVATAYVGLSQAAARWDPTREEINPEDLKNGKAFSGYARQRIVGAILDWQRKQDYVKPATRKLYKLLVAGGLHEGAPLEDLALEVGEPVSKLEKCIQEINNPPVQVDPAEEEYRFVQNTHKSIELTSMLIEAVNAIKSLPELHQVVLVMKYYSEMTQQQISSELELPLATISTSHRESIQFVHSVLAEYAKKEM